MRSVSEAGAHAMSNDTFSNKAEAFEAFDDVPTH
jgi:hypothetical protein